MLPFPVAFAFLDMLALIEAAVPILNYEPPIVVLIALPVVLFFVVEGEGAYPVRISFWITF